MVINSVKAFSTADVAKYSWARIAPFQNVESTASVITQIHQLPTNQLHNARRQAEALKYCLAQAKEYFDAAQAVSIATKPVLLYYSCMSMALAQILLKQTGVSRLSVLREQHNCHGLQLTLAREPKIEDSLTTASSALSAKAQLQSEGNAKGTFEVWRRSAREYPVGGYHTVTFPNGSSQKSYQAILFASDIPIPPLRQAGVSLHECLCQLPYMADLLTRMGSQLAMVRATVRTFQSGLSGTRTSTTIVHPTSDAMLERFGELVVCDPAAVNSLDIRETPSSYIINQQLDNNLPGIRQWPNSICLSDEDVYFSCSDTDLGEFGHLYIALHICGNFARYYPDIWLKHIEKSSPLALAIDELCGHAMDRLPLLTMSELTSSYHVADKIALRNSVVSGLT